MAEDFGKQMAKITAKYKARMRATAREAVQDTVDIAQTAIAKGGKMPVDTGFLRASIVANVGSMPSGKTQPTGNRKYSERQTVSGEPISVSLLKWEPGDKLLFIGWSAAYARRLEYGFSGQDSLGRTYNQQGMGFLRGAVELWPRTVDAAAKRVRKRI